ncbi:transporter suffix domain-containing protein [uncultured Thiodictyon sp.]|uniref:transporter suffix domain-containing protein n=1 Tax=uncultured Thiodictyon sp. TaxID=1846217 RepID=UPI0025D927CF|nr:transporter suffix domain-containing protein [uncultured Thiodictyon sp.]
MVDAQDAAAPQPSAFTGGPRTYAGMAALVLAFILPVFVIVIPFLGLSAKWSALLTTGLLVGGPELLTLVAVALLGKDALRYFTDKVKQALWGLVIETRVSKFQYYLGLSLSLASILPLYIYGYLPGLLPEGGRIPILAAADLIFIASMFIMGGEFWEKVQRIFVWEGKD